MTAAATAAAHGRRVVRFPDQARMLPHDESGSDHPRPAPVRSAPVRPAAVRPAAAPAEARSGRSDRRRIISDDTTGLERRRGPGRRLSDTRKAAEEGEMNREQFLFLMAIDAFKRGNQVWYPSWTDVLEVIRLLGYRKTMPSELNLPNAEDWSEAPESPAGVRPPGWDRRERMDRKAA